MNATETNSTLNRLRIIHTRSFAAYVYYAAPWILKGFHGVADVLEIMGSEVERIADHVGEMILSNGGQLIAGEFPIEFTGLHDLSVDYLLGVIIEHQEKDIVAIQECVNQLDANPLGQALAEEALGAAKGHLDSLQELVATQSDA